MASIIFDLPPPFGPTIEVISKKGPTKCESPNDLKFYNFRYSIYLIKGPALESSG
jgi:hypothetical protein